MKETSHIPREKEALWAAEKIKSLLSDELIGLYFYGAAVFGGLHSDSEPVFWRYAGCLSRKHREGSLRKCFSGF